VWKTRRDFEAEIIAKAWEDKAFKARLLKDPRSVVEELSGEKLPQEMKVSVFEENATSVCLVLPRSPDEELSEADLEKVAGGVKLGAEEQARYQNNVFTRL
jgi:hypothetical protein